MRIPCESLVLVRVGPFEVARLHKLHKHLIAYHIQLNLETKRFSSPIAIRVLCSYELDTNQCAAEGGLYAVNL